MSAVRKQHLAAGGPKNSRTQVFGSVLALGLWLFFQPALATIEKNHPASGKPGSCRSYEGQRPSGTRYDLPVRSNEIKIMQYNVENLFDTEHDENKNDYEFLPRANPLKSHCADNPTSSYRKACEDTDWVPSRLRLKLDQIKHAIDAQGELPDILTVEEVENENVISMLAKHLGYQKYIITDGPDERGIDVAILYNETKVQYLSHAEFVVGPNDPDLQKRPTRNILGVYFQPKSTGAAKALNRAPEVLAVYANHWPSQSWPSAKRALAAKALREAMDKDSQKFGKNNYNVVALGDFNTISTEKPSPFDAVTDGKWDQSLRDVHSLYEGTYNQKDPDNMMGKMPPGSYFFKKDLTWNRLDHIFINGKLLSNNGMTAMPETFRVVGADSLSRPFRSGDNCPTIQIPNRYEHNADRPEQAGFSDHYPVVFKVRLQ